MTRLLCILLVALLLGPQVGTIFVPADECQEERACGGPDGECDVNCVTCACCRGRALGSTNLVSLEPAGPRKESPRPFASAIVLPVFPTEILHVPKSA